MSCLHYFLHDEEINPLLDDALPILVDKFNGNLFVLTIERLGAFFLTAHDIFQFSTLYYQIKDTFRTTVLYMHMYWFMFVRKEIEDESKIFKYLWHTIIFAQIYGFSLNKQTF